MLIPISFQYRVKQNKILEIVDDRFGPANGNGAAKTTEEAEEPVAGD